MLFSRYFPRILLLLGLFVLLAVPSFADDAAVTLDSVTEAGKGKKGDAPPRPRPKPGPQEGGDDD